MDRIDALSSPTTSSRTMPALDAALEASEAAGLPPIKVAPNQGKLLMLLAQAIGARRILEIGTLGGYSTIWLARGACSEAASSSRSKPIPTFAEVARPISPAPGLAERVEIGSAARMDTLPALIEADAPFDLIFIDADKPSTPDYFHWAVKLARRGALIVVDNVVREGRVLDAHGDSPRSGHAPLLSSSPRPTRA